MEGEYCLMNSIVAKKSSLRTAVAEAIVTVSRTETIAAIQNGTVPKGNVFEFSRAAGLFGVKRTSDVIPDCHPLPVEFTAITHRIADLSIYITVEVHTVYKTGVEVEAMHGASVSALTLYDMLKPIDPGIVISGIRLVRKTGGKSATAAPRSDVKCAVVVCSDTVFQGINKDSSGKAIIDRLGGYGIHDIFSTAVPDEQDAIRNTAIHLKDKGFDLVIFCGGTGLSPRDVTPEALEPLIDRPIPGLMEAARNFGQQRTPFAMLSRGVAGFSGDTLLLTTPGSRSGALDTLDALFPQLLHVFNVKAGERHD